MGSVMGMLSTHFNTPHRPGEDALRHLDLLVRQTTDIMEHAQAAAEKKLLQDRLQQAQPA